MNNEYADEAEESVAAQGDRSLEHRPGDLRDQGPRPSAEHDQGLEPDGNIPSRRNGHLQADDSLEAEIIHQVTDAVTQVTRIAPLPEPRELQQYDRVQPGLADRIVRMAEESAAAANAATHADAEVSRAVASSIREDANAIQRGQWMFLVLAVFCLAAAVWLAFAGQPAISVALGVLGTINIFGVLIRPVNGKRWRPGHGEESATDSS